MKHALLGRGSQHVAWMQAKGRNPGAPRIPLRFIQATGRAFGGMDLMLSAYRHAVAERYRFFSYGDAMLIERHAQ